MRMNRRRREIGAWWVKQIREALEKPNSKRRLEKLARTGPPQQLELL
jgi:hypothetical protein